MNKLRRGPRGWGGQCFGRSNAMSLLIALFRFASPKVYLHAKTVCGCFQFMVDECARVESVITFPSASSDAASGYHRQPTASTPAGGKARWRHPLGTAPSRVVSESQHIPDGADRPTSEDQGCTERTLLFKIAPIPFPRTTSIVGTTTTNSVTSNLGHPDAGRPSWRPYSGRTTTTYGFPTRIFTVRPTVTLFCRFLAFVTIDAVQWKPWVH